MSWRLWAPMLKWPSRTSLAQWSRRMRWKLARSIPSTCKPEGIFPFLFYCANISPACIMYILLPMFCKSWRHFFKAPIFWRKWHKVSKLKINLWQFWSFEDKTCSLQPKGRNSSLSIVKAFDQFCLPMRWATTIGPHSSPFDAEKRQRPAASRVGWWTAGNLASSVSQNGQQNWSILLDPPVVWDC